MNLPTPHPSPESHPSIESSQWKRRDWLKLAALGALVPVLPGSPARAAEGYSRGARDWTAILNVCAWPQLERLRDGTILAVIFNQPCHGLWEGDLECWASTDDGGTWKLRSQVTNHAPGTVRMNCAFGQAENGDLVVLCSGWDKRNPVGGPPTPASTGKPLRAQIFRSTDDGRTWQYAGVLPDPPQVGIGKDNNFMTFGHIQPGADGVLGVAAYLWERTGRREAHFMRSMDHGKTWEDGGILNPMGNETALLHFGNGRWLAASRQFHVPLATGVHLKELQSTDNGRTWTRGPELTLPGQIPGHLLRLRDGRTLLTYGNRNWGNYGIDARVSHDDAKTW